MDALEARFWSCGAILGAFFVWSLVTIASAAWLPAFFIALLFTLSSHDFDLPDGGLDATGPAGMVHRNAANRFPYRRATLTRPQNETEGMH